MAAKKPAKSQPKASDATPGKAKTKRPKKTSRGK
jgi:hypothetical protein